MAEMTAPVLAFTTILLLPNLYRTDEDGRVSLSFAGTVREASPGMSISGCVVRLIQ